MDGLIIDKDFKDWITPLTREEYKQLESNIIADGCRDPLVVWKDTILDGHNRYAICVEHGLPFAVIKKNFDTHQDALNWIIDNQLGRRNLAPWQMSVLRGKRYNAVKLEPHRPEKQLYQNDTVIPTREKVAQQFGVSPATIQRDGAFAKAAEQTAQDTNTPIMQLTKEQILSTAREINREKQAERRVDRISSTPTIPDGKYNIIYADPPWKYDFGFDIHGAADRHYATLTPSEIAALPVKELFEDNAVLFMWATSPKLEEAFTVINGWGFKYKTSFIWDKVKHVMGHYNSVRHELLLICTRGSFPKQSDTLTDSVVSIERSDEHSEKPEEFRKIIEDMYPIGKKIELFGRKQIDGWDVWGNQA